jgi:inhibitor of cysteine peptidase
MKIKIALLLVLMIGCIGLGACTAANADSGAKLDLSVQAGNADFTSSANKTVTRSIGLAVGQKVVVSLWSNPTTGYSWSEQAAIQNNTLMTQLDHKFVAPTDSQVVGAAGSEVWTFQATATGETTVTLQYGQPWSGGEKTLYTFALTVTVK